MNVQSDFVGNDKTLRIRVSGHFTHAVHEEFSTACKLLSDSHHRKCVIDLSRADYLDSAALGMLLLLRERNGGERAQIILSGAKGDVKNILEISGFKKLFTFT